MVDRIRYPTVSYLPFYYVFFQFVLLTIFNLQANILTTKDILSNLVYNQSRNPDFAVLITFCRDFAVHLRASKPLWLRPLRLSLHSWRRPFSFTMPTALDSFIFTTYVDCRMRSCVTDLLLEYLYVSIVRDYSVKVNSDFL